MMDKRKSITYIFNGGDRVKIGLAYGADGSLTSWEGGPVTKTGWADKQYIAVNLPDVLPGIVTASLRRTSTVTA